MNKGGKIVLLLCTKDLYTSNFKKKIFTSGKVYKATLGVYEDQLTQEELMAFKKITNDYPIIENFLKWKVIIAVNDYEDRWLIEIFEDTYDYYKNPFKNENFAQISTFNGGIIN